MRKIPLALAVLAALAFSACWWDTPTGPTTTVVVTNNIGTTPSPAPSAAPTAPPTSPCDIVEVKVVFVGEEQCPSGGPDTHDKTLRAGCTQFLTCTPKTRNSLGQEVDAPVSCTGNSPTSFKLTSDTANTTLSDHDGNPFNVDAVAEHSGSFTLECVVLGKPGSSTFTVVP